MSLIEKAMGKAKVASVSASPVSVPAFAGSMPRNVPEPGVRLTEAMIEALGLLAPKEQERQRASEYRHIKRQVMSELRDNAARRIIVVASALAGEGKSFTSANLARSLALEPDHTVLLIDADVIKPFISQTFGIAERRGLMDALLNPEILPEDLVLSTDVEGLSVMPAGRASDRATEYFASGRARDVFEQLLAVPNRIIVVDTLPLLQTTEARALSTFAGQVLLVVRAESTPQGAVREALSMLGKSANVKLVLNATVRTRVTKYLGHGYGHGYDYSYSTSRSEGTSS